MKAHIVMSINGKLITDASTLSQFDCASILDIKKLITRSFLEECTELEVTILPFILGGSQDMTLGGMSTDFLKKPLNFSLIKKTVKKNKVQLSYIRRSF